MALFIGRIPRDMSTRDLEDVFSKYGSITRLDLKQGFGFVEFEDNRDAEDALKGVKDHEQIIVEWAKNGGKRPGENECFHCGKEGHWARDCRARNRDGGSRFGGRDRDRSPRRDRRDFGRRDYDRRDRDRSPRRDYRSKDYQRPAERRDRGFARGDERDSRKEDREYRREDRGARREEREEFRNGDRASPEKEDRE
ncbi:uncharacterized protein BYT42DRAFT_551325 [Radiomyces spectabilis]|uniref:uncharacterized protein n=1 Tax=Radiomyces spectabilis TaxID=64574 RepID=UPI00221ECD94|nr:uncharacterized protein BYT42DRAFT_551325 [Radiomyces spectabilis]KAI8393518.1 hypothetical protein BYT42DRAFT_551325 [Radiomyces spectabilis]